MLAVAALQLRVDADRLGDLNGLATTIQDLASRAMVDMADAALRARTLGGALTGALAARPWTAVRAMIENAIVDPRRTALAALAPHARAWLHQLFAAISRRHRAYVVAGSGPRALGPGRIVNSSTVFGPDGRARAVTDQVNLLPGLDDGGGLSLSRGKAGPVVGTGIGMGTLATLVGYDGQAKPLSSAERFAFLAEQARAEAPGLLACPVAWPAERVADLAPGFDGGAALCPSEGGLVVRACLVGQLVDRPLGGRSAILRRSGQRVETLAEAGAEAADHLVTALVDAPG